MDSSRLTFKPRIIIIGGGNVATHFTCAFSQTEASIIALAPGCRQSVADLSSNYGINCIQQVEDIPSDVDAVIIATNDSATAEVANLLPQIRGVVIHTSGSVPLSVLSTKHNRAGVLYPLQTFSKNVAVDIKEVPFFIGQPLKRLGETFLFALFARVPTGSARRNITWVNAPGRGMYLFSRR